MSKKSNAAVVAEALTTEHAMALPEVFRVVAMHFSGNTGKTTLCRHLLKPAMPAAELIRVESINDSGSSSADIELAGKQFEEVAKQLFVADGHVIVDIGASNVEQARNVLKRLGDAHEEVDLWVVPCIQVPGKDAKIYRDTIATLKELVALGVDPNRIAVIKNKVSEVTTMDDDFADLVSVAEVLGCRVIDRPVLAFDLYSDLDQRPGSLDEIASDTTDYKSIMREHTRAGDLGKAEEAVSAEFRRKNARTVLRNLTMVRADLFSPYLVAGASA